MPPTPTVFQHDVPLENGGRYLMFTELAIGEEFIVFDIAKLDADGRISAEVGFPGVFRDYVGYTVDELLQLIERLEAFAATFERSGHAGHTQPPEPLDWFASYYRIGSNIGHWDGDGDSDRDTYIPRPTAIIRSLAELRAYYFANTWIINSGYSPTADALFYNDDFYNDDFFAENFLVFVYTLEGSGSVRQNIVSVVVEDGVLRIHANRQHPGLGTHDMAGWLIAVEVGRDFVNLPVEVEWSHSGVRWCEESRDLVGEWDSSVLTTPLESFLGVEYNRETLVFRFAGRHSRVEGLSFWGLTRDGSPLDPNEWQFGDGLRERRPIYRNGETHFIFPIYFRGDDTSGTFVADFQYLSERFQTEPFHIPPRGSAPYEQLGFGGLTASDIHRIQLYRGGWFYNEQWDNIWRTSDEAVISDLLDHLQGLRGQPTEIDFNRGSHLVTVRFELTDGNVIAFSTRSLGEYHSGRVEYRMTNAKSAAEWEAFIARLEWVR
jgi:hypothetical protein